MKWDIEKSTVNTAMDSTLLCYKLVGTVGKNFNRIEQYY